MKQSKGFSLVELIIVIAIMAILVGVMAPLLIKYIEKTNISADIQLCDTIHDAIMTSASDPEVIADEVSQKMLYDAGGILDPASTTGQRLDSYGSGSQWTTCAFAQNVTDIVGVDIFTQGCNHSQYLKSRTAKDSGIICVVPNQEGTDCAVYIAWSNRDGDGAGENYNGTYYGLESSKVIFVK